MFYYANNISLCKYISTPLSYTCYSGPGDYITGSDKCGRFGFFCVITIVLDLFFLVNKLCPGEKEEKTFDKEKNSGFFGGIKKICDELSLMMKSIL